MFVVQGTDGEGGSRSFIVDSVPGENRVDGKQENEHLLCILGHVQTRAAPGSLVSVIGTAGIGKMAKERTHPIYPD
jgi:hypothetical protein